MTCLKISQVTILVLARMHLLGAERLSSVKLDGILSSAAETHSRDRPAASKHDHAKPVSDSVKTKDTALLEAESGLTQQAGGGPKFFAKPTTAAVKYLWREENLYCGEPILLRVDIEPSLLTEIVSAPMNFLEEKEITDGETVNKYLAAKRTKAWSRTGFADAKMLDGQEMTLVSDPAQAGGGLVDTVAAPTTFADLAALGGQWLLAEKGAQIVFEAGLDLRLCWGDIQDLQGRDICGQTATDELQSLMTAKAVDKGQSDDAMGFSGSTIITNIPGWIIKNVKDMQEYYMMKETFPELGRNIEKRQGGCYRSAIAPICGVVFSSNGVPWVVMRAVGIHGAEGTSLDLDGDGVDKFDLKSPKFANSLMDGRQYSASKDVWHRKESGFVRIFADGMPLGACGARDGAIALGLDAGLLESLQMTDYSLFGTMWKPPSTDECTCSDVPKWPILINALPTGSTPAVQFAFGIIDYIERNVNRNVGGNKMSTMKEPPIYRRYFLMMLPQFFRLPTNYVMEKSVSLTYVKMVSQTAPTEKFSWQQKVWALTTLMWTKTTTKTLITIKTGIKAAPVEHHTVGLHTERIRPEKAGTEPTADVRVFSLTTGTIVGFKEPQQDQMYVMWDNMEKPEYERDAFLVDPHEIVGEKRVFL